MEVRVVKIDELKSVDKTIAEVEEQIITEMAESIESEGLLHPITIDKNTLRLVAGRKRVLAFIKLGRTEIPANFLEGLEADQIEEISLHENIRRTYLPWWERAFLAERLHQLRQKQHGIKKAGRPRNDGANLEGWGLKETAKELGMALGPLSEDLNLARAVRTDPRLRNIKDRTTALKIVKMEARRAEREADTLWVEEAVLEIKDQLFNGSAEDVLKRFPDNTFDLCITDPPWLKYIDKSLTADDQTVPVFKEIYRVLKRNTMLFMFVGFEDFFMYRDVLPGFGFTISNTPLIWHKEGQGVTYGVRAWEYNRDYELILIAAKGSPSLTHTVTKSSILTYKPVHPRHLIHPNEKPLDLIKQLIGDGCFDEGMILDPFAGSGVIGSAAVALSRHYTLIERDPETFGKIKKRLEK